MPLKIPGDFQLAAEPEIGVGSTSMGLLDPPKILCPACRTKIPPTAAKCPNCHVALVPKTFGEIISFRHVMGTLAPTEQPQSAVGFAGDTRVEALTKLGSLKEQGLLTDAEFEAEKRRILGS